MKKKYHALVGQKMFAAIITLVAIFVLTFVLFQLSREKQYKVGLLDTRLQAYNNLLNENLADTDSIDFTEVDRFLNKDSVENLRVTIILPNGDVAYDSGSLNPSNMSNHAKRVEVADALHKGTGYALERKSSTTGKEYFYSATYFPLQNRIIRSALPYSTTLHKSLNTDMRYLWFALATLILLALLMYRFTHRLDRNIGRLRTFADSVEAGERIDAGTTIRFPNDELGEIAQRIVTLYKRLQDTRGEQDRLKRQLTQNVAHELKTPVAGIQGYLETIIENPEMDNTTRWKFLQRCYAQTRRLSDLVADISTLNRLDDAPETLQKETVDINQIVEQTIEDTSLLLNRQHMQFHNLLPKNIIVNGDPSLLYSVFRNLTDNSAAYAGEHSVITLTAFEDNTHWNFTFQDNGQGVSLEHLGRLFERFYRVDKGRSRKLGGTGLGLSIVKNVILLHGGSVQACVNQEGGLSIDFSIRK